MKRSPLLSACCFGFVFGPSEDERGGKDFDFAYLGSSSSSSIIYIIQNV